MTQNLTLHFDRKLYLIADSAENRRLIGKYIDVFQYRDGRIEIRSGCTVILYSSGPSTAHRPDGIHVPRKAARDTKTQCQLSMADIDSAIQSKASLGQMRRGLREVGLTPTTR